MDMPLADFLLKLALGSAMILLNLGIQVYAVYRVTLYFQRRDLAGKSGPTPRREMHALSVVMLFLFVGHILQFATWALLFMAVGEFESFATAFYHSTVNFTSLGYGDIVMSDAWRLLGGLEAANGVLMFGLTAGLVLSVLSSLFVSNDDVAALKAVGRSEAASEE